MSKRIFALLLALVMMLSLLTACGGSTERRDKHAAINQDADALQQSRRMIPRLSLP
jgi:outer membrane biogenesis lipoprotein LolB